MGENTLPAFARAVSLGVGVEADVLMTADGEPVLLHAPMRRYRGRAIRRLPRSALPSTVPSLDELFARCGAGFPLALDMVDPLAAPAVVETARRHGALGNLWLTHWRVDVLAPWREEWPSVHLVVPRLVGRSSERLFTRLAAVGIDALNTHHRMVSSRLVSAAQERGVEVFAWGIRRGHSLDVALSRGATGVFADDAATLADAIRRCVVARQLS